MIDPAPADRSAQACPVCGAHRLALIDFPDVHGAVPPVDTEMFGVVVSGEPTPPAIGCLACGAEWSDLASFRLAAGD